MWGDTCQFEAFPLARFIFDTGSDFFHLELGFGAIVCADPLQAFPCLLVAALQCQPAD